MVSSYIQDTLCVLKGVLDESDVQGKGHMPKLDFFESAVPAFPTTPQLLMRELLSHKDYTATRIAQELDISKACVTRILNGEIKKMRGTTFNRLLSLYCSVFVRNASGS